MIRFLIFIFFITTLLFVNQIFSADINVSVSVIVIDNDDSTPISKATVEIDNRLEITNAQGRVMIKKLKKPGELVNVSVWKDGYGKKQGTFLVVDGYSEYVLTVKLVKDANPMTGLTFQPYLPEANKRTDEQKTTIDDKDTKSTTQTKVAPPSAKRQLQEDYNKAISLLSVRNWNEAITYFEKVAAVDSNYADVSSKLKFAKINKYYNDGLTFFNETKWDSALLSFEKVIKLDPTYNAKEIQQKINDIKANISLEEGSKALINGDWKLARQKIENSLRINPSNKQARQKLAELDSLLQYEISVGNENLKNKKWNKAKISFEKVLEVDSTSIPAIKGLNKAIEGKNRDRNTLITFIILLLLLVSLGAIFILKPLPVRNILINFYISQRMYEKAATELLNIISFYKDKNDGKSVVKYYIWALSAGIPKEICTDKLHIDPSLDDELLIQGEEILKNKPLSGNLRIRIVEKYIERNNIAEVKKHLPFLSELNIEKYKNELEKIYKSILSTNENDIDAKRELGKLYLDTGRYSSAVEVVLSAYKNNKNDSGLRQLLEKCLAQCPLEDIAVYFFESAGFSVDRQPTFSKVIRDLLISPKSEFASSVIKLFPKVDEGKPILVRGFLEPPITDKDLVDWYKEITNLQADRYCGFAFLPSLSKGEVNEAVRSVEIDDESPEDIDFIVVVIPSYSMKKALLDLNCDSVIKQRVEEDIKFLCDKRAEAEKKKAEELEAQKAKELQEQKIKEAESQKPVEIETPQLISKETEIQKPEEPKIQKEEKFIPETPIKEIEIYKGEIMQLPEDSNEEKLVDVFISEAIKKRAGQIHLVPVESSNGVISFILRYGVDGIFNDVYSLSNELGMKVIKRLKSVAGIVNEGDNSIQVGKFFYEATISETLKKQYNVKIHIVPLAKSVKVIIKIFDVSQSILPISELGFSSEVIGKLEALLTKGSGSIVITGPNYSGKTLILYTLLKKILKDKGERVKVATIEDYIDYEMQSIRQIQISTSHGLTQADALRTLYGQGWQVIGIENVKEPDVVKLVMHGGTTGHFIIATMDSLYSAEVFTRCLEVGTEAFMLASSMLGILSVRLVRTICQKCKEEYTPSDEILSKFSTLSGSLTFNQPLPSLPNVFVRGRGCNDCNFTGYKGCTSISEILVNNDKIRELILNKPTRNDIPKIIEKADMRSILYDGIRKVKDGTTTIEEIIRVI